MTPADVERVFGRSRLQIPTGRHVEVFREVARSGEERRYTKRFLVTESVDFRPWTEREYRVLVRLGRLQGAPVAKALDLLPADESGARRLQTRDAGATLDQWATLVPLRRGETILRNVFDDCANWWALARQCMVALDALHALGFVHLDLKPDNVCIPWAPAGAGRPLPGQPLAPRVKALALIDVAFSLVPEVDLRIPLPLLREPDYDYQSPRLLHALEEGRRGNLAATRALDWRCDFYSLAAMLWRYLPEADDAPGSGWNGERHAEAQEFVQQLLDIHNAPPSIHWPHRHLIGLAALRLRDPDLQAAVQAGCTFDPQRELPLDAEPTPPTRIAHHVPRKPEPDGIVGAETGRTAAVPMTLGEARREPTTEPEPAPAPAAASAPAVAAIYSGPGDLDEAHDPALGETLPDVWPPQAPPPSSEATSSDGAPMRIGPRQRRQTVLAAVATSVVGVAAVVALWLSIGRSLGPMTTAGVPLPSASEARADHEPTSAHERDATPARATASAPIVIAATPPVARPPSSDPVTASAATTPAPAVGESASGPLEKGVPASDDLDALASDILKNRIPATALSAERRLARVLAVAAGASEFRRRGDVRTAMQAMRSATPKVLFDMPLRNEEARRLNEAALVAYWRRDDVDDALRLQRKAFAANPLDSEVVGNLAFLQLRQQPPKAESARQLALHSLALNDPRFPSGRIADWTAFAVASALTGHEADARNAWFASMALANDLQQQCANAVRAEAIYGERLRPSVQAMLQRARSSAAYGRCDAALSPQPEGAKRKPSAPSKSSPKSSPNTPANSTAKAMQRNRRAVT